MILSFFAIVTTMVEKIPQHRHCENCGKAFIGEGKFCGESCQGEKENKLKVKKRQLMIIWLISAAVIIGALLTVIL